MVVCVTHVNRLSRERRAGTPKLSWGSYIRGIEKVTVPFWFETMLFSLITPRYGYLERYFNALIPFPTWVKSTTQWWGAYGRIETLSTPPRTVKNRNKTLNNHSNDIPNRDDAKNISHYLLENIPEDLLFSLLDNAYESLILVDAQGIVRFMSQSNEGYSDISVKNSLGRHIQEIRPDTKMTRVLETGRAEIGRSMLVNKNKRIVARIPLFKDNRLIGVMGKMMFTSPDKLKQLYERIDCLKNQIDYYKDVLHQSYATQYTFDNIIGNSKAILKCKALARKAAQSDASVLITGESGTGKELFAHAIHQISQRSKSNFVRVNCASIPSELIESELFGYEAGAFTGASKKGKAGKFELANHGTIFLDEIGDMPPLLQVKLMRVLQEKEVERLGGKPQKIDFRVISATNCDLNKMVSDKTFRLDLYYRLNVFVITLPSLRDIKEDIPEIFNHFLDKLSRGNRREPPTVSRKQWSPCRAIPGPAILGN